MLPEGLRETGQRLFERMIDDYQTEIASAVDIAESFASKAASPAERNARLNELGATPIERWGNLLPRAAASERPRTAPEAVAAPEKEKGETKRPADWTSADDGMFKAIEDSEFRSRYARGETIAERDQVYREWHAKEKTGKTLEGMSESQRTLFNEAKAAIPEIAEVDLAIAIAHPLKLEGLPEVKGMAETYVLPSQSAGGLGMVREIFYKNAEGKIVKKLIKSALEKNDGTDQLRKELLAEEAYKMRIVAEWGEHPNLMRADRGSVRDAGENIHFILEPAGTINGRDALYDPFHPLTPGRAVSLTSQVVRGLRVIHEHGCIHRDLKWGNAMVDGEGHVRIIDFGTLSAQPNPSSPALQALAVNNRMEAASGGVVTTPGIFEGSKLDPELYRKMNEESQFRSEYDYIAVFQMIHEATTVIDAQKAPSKNPLVRMWTAARNAMSPQTPDARFARMRAIAEEGLNTESMARLGELYRELEGLIQ